MSLAMKDRTIQSVPTSEASSPGQLKILILSQFFPPDITAAAFRLGDMSSQLAAAGHDVKVLAGEPHKASAGGVIDNLPAEANLDVRRCRVRQLHGTGAKAYLKHYFSFVRSSVAEGFRIWREGWRPDVLYVSSPPLFVGLAARLLSRLFGCSMLLEIRDIWPDSAVAAGQLSPGGRAYRVGRRLEKHLYRTAREIVCVAEPMAAYIRSQCKTPVAVCYNGIRADDVPAYIPAQDSAKAMRTLMYAGNFGRVQDLRLVVDAFSQLREERRVHGWQLVLMGDGACREELAKQVLERGSSEIVQLEPPVARDKAYARMLEADALYLSLMRSSVLEHTIPSKLFDYLAICRPIVAAIGGEGAEILASLPANMCVNPGDLEALKSAIEIMCNQIEERQGLAQEHRNFVLERFTREKSVEVLCKSLHRVARVRRRLPV